MSIKLSKARSALLIFAVVMSNVTVMGEFATFPIIDALYDHFSEQSFWVDTWLSLNQWIIVIFSIVASMLLKKISKKTLLMAGGIIFAIGGIFGAAVDNIVFMTAMRIPYGIGVAFCNVGAVAIVAEVYTDEDKMNFVMGIYNSLQAALGAGISVIGGYMAAESWAAPFKFFWMSIPMIIIFAVCIPYIKVENQPEEKKTAVSGKKEALGREFWLTTIAFILFASAYAIPSEYASSYVIENGIGNEVIAGYVGSLGTLGSFVFCLFYEKMFKKLNKKVIVLWYGLAAALILVLFAAPVKAVCLPTYFVLGGSMSIACTYTYAIIPDIVPASRVDDGIGIMTAACCIGYGIAPYLTSVIQTIVRSEAIMPTIAGAAVIVLLATVIEIPLSKKKQIA